MGIVMGSQSNLRMLAGSMKGDFVGSCCMCCYGNIHSRLFGHLTIWLKNMDIIGSQQQHWGSLEDGRPTIDAWEILGISPTPWSERYNNWSCHFDSFSAWVFCRGKTSMFLQNLEAQQHADWIWLNEESTSTTDKYWKPFPKNVWLRTAQDGNVLWNGFPHRQRRRILPTAPLWFRRQPYENVIRFVGSPTPTWNHWNHPKNQLPSGKLTYWKWAFLVDWPIKNVDLP